MGAKLYINGRCVEGEGEIIRVVNPATGKTAGEFRGASIAQAEEALQSAKSAFDSWSRLSITERESWMRKLKEAYLEERDALVELLAEERGCVYPEAVEDYELIPEYLDYFPEEAKRMLSTGLPQLDEPYGETYHEIIRRPVGVVAGHLAWNCPFFNVGLKMAPAMASGCTCVLRPSSATPLATLKLGEIFESIGFPAGVVNLVAGPSDTIGSYISSSPVPSLLSVIGSADTGKEVIRAGSLSSVKHYSMELGGNAPAILMPDCDTDEVVKWLLRMKKDGAGQQCSNVNRVFVHESVHDEFVEKLVREAEKIPLGWGKDAPENAMGAMINKKVRDEKLKLVEDTVAMGAKLLCGGKVPEDALGEELRDGAFMYMTVLDGCTDDMPVFSQELFAPLICIYTFSDTDDVIRRANNTPAGLQSYVFTHDSRLMAKFIEGLRFGGLNFNSARYGGINIPHIGIKNSGMGCVRSRWSMDEYYYMRRVSIIP